MNIWLRAGLTRYLGRRLRFSRESNNSELLGLAPFYPIFDPAVRPSKLWRRTLSTESGGGRSRPRKTRSRKDYPSQIPLPKFRDDPRVWMLYLEPYIPQSSRQGTEYQTSSKPPESVQCRAILHILYQARALSKIDLLAYLGIKLNRWESVYALIWRLLDNAEELSSSPARAQLPSNLDWAAIGTFDYITSIHLNGRGVPVKKDKETPSLAAFDVYTEEPQMSGQMGEYDARLGTMEEIWQSLGSIVLEAADLPIDESRRAMSYVYRVLARLHHIDFIPNEVYKYAPTNEPGALNRPPAMQILSSHIMNVLSDAVWQANEAEVATKAAEEGTKVDPPRYKMRVRELGHGIWLDFILWCCVEGGFAKEGTWILERMKERSGGKVWSVKSWESLQLSADAIHPSSVDRDHLWGESVKLPDIESPQSEDPFQGLGERTICSEVVSALMDGLINTLNVGVGHRGNSPGYIQDNIAILRSILDRNESAATSNYLLSLIIRIFEAGSVVPEAEPQALEHVLKLAPPVSPEQLGSGSPASQGTESAPPSTGEIPNYSAAILGMYRYTLDVYSFVGNVGGALDIFKTILSYVDAAKLQYTREFARELKRLVRSWEQKNAEEAHSQLLGLELDSGLVQRSSIPQLPNSTLALLLDISTSSKAYSFGNWLLSSKDPDGPVIPRNAYGDQVLAPAIIRFATATKNQNILSAVTRNLTVPLSNNVLKAILSYKIAVFDWDNVARLFAHLRDAKNGHWGVSNVTSLAGAIVVLDKRRKTSQEQHSLDTAKGILIQLLEGRYNRRQNPAGAPYTYQEEVLYQLHRMFLTVPGQLSEACSTANLQWKPRGRDTVRNISAIAFRNLLSAVVEYYGSAEGKRLWDLWCSDPESPEGQRVQSGGTSLLYFSNELFRVDGGAIPFYDKERTEAQRTKAVVPDLRTVRIIAQGAVVENQKFQVEKEADSTTVAHANDNNNGGITQESTEEVLEWCIETFRKFRLRDPEIDRELEGYLTQWKQKRRSRKSTAAKATNPNTD